IAITPIIPSADGRGKLLLDAGANLELKPFHLEQFAIAASIIVRDVLKWDLKPKVGLLNIGTEPGKGRELEKETYKILSENENINFVGNIEPKDCMIGDADIILSDGFSANILMKGMEGTAKGVSKIIKRSIGKNIFHLLGAFLLKGTFKTLKETLDPSTIGGAIILGVRKTAIKAQGASNYKAVSNAIRQAKNLVEGKVIEKVKEELKL
ncbi:MAG: phosphate acyltransferase, partial [Acholeplasmatales bacterium]|nr:phosphate acyltransferase [Acholeplasmatales bacterium]